MMQSNSVAVSKDRCRKSREGGQAGPSWITSRGSVVALPRIAGAMILDGKNPGPPHDGRRKAAAVIISYSGMYYNLSG